MEEDPALSALQSAQFRSYCLKLLESNLSPAETYQRILDYFRMPLQEPDRALYSPGTPVEKQSTAPEARNIGGGDTFNFLAFSESVTTAASILRAVKRLARSQHQDGGWGTQVEQSDLWHTAYALLALNAARRSEELVADVEVTACLSRGYAYLEQHAPIWAADALEPEGSVSVYHVCLVARCFFAGGRDFFRRETAVRVYRSLDHLHHAQNEDGGWDACLWGYAVMTPTRLFSDVGATSAALQALALMREDHFIPAMHKAAQWLFNTQNLDGSWNDGSARPDLPPLTLTGDPRLCKTCDALLGFASLQSFELPLEPYEGAVSRALSWINDRLKPVLGKSQNPKGWGWGFTRADYENACLALETLLKFPRLSPSLLRSTAGWLIENQRKQEGDAEDGSWVLGHTARITTALVDYYRTLRGPTLDNRWLP